MAGWERRNTQRPREAKASQVLDETEPDPDPRGRRRMVMTQEREEGGQDQKTFINIIFFCDQCISRN